MTLLRHILSPMRAPDESTSAEPLGTPILRAEDGELRGSVARREDGRWVAQAVFGGVIGIGDTAGEARALVERDGLASLSWRWFYRPRPGADWEVVVIQEAWPGRAVVVEGAYALAGMPTVEIRAEDLAAGVEMTLEPPNDDLAQFASRRD